MSDDRTSFVRGMFAGAIHEELLFPFPAPLRDRDPDEARTVRRLLADIDRMRGGLIDSAKFDEEETVPEAVIHGVAEAGVLRLTLRHDYVRVTLSASAHWHGF